MTTVFQRVGPFEIVSQIGEGGMGVVFLAEDTRSGARVALKLVPTLGSTPPTTLEPAPNGITATSVPAAQSSSATISASFSG